MVSLIFWRFINTLIKLVFDSTKPCSIQRSIWPHNSTKPTGDCILNFSSSLKRNSTGWTGPGPGAPGQPLTPRQRLSTFPQWSLQQLHCWRQIHGSLVKSGLRSRTLFLHTLSGIYIPGYINNDRLYCDILTICYNEHDIADNQCDIADAHFYTTLLSSSWSRSWSLPDPNLVLQWLGSFPSCNWARSRHYNQTDHHPTPPQITTHHPHHHP